MKNIVVGLDIGTTKIATIIAQKNELGKIEILGYGNAPSAGIMRGSVMNIDKAVESIKASVEQAELRSGIKINEVYVGIAGQHIKSFQRRSELIRTSEEEITLQEITDFVNLMYNVQVSPGERILHVTPQEFVIDNEPGIQDPVGMSGHELIGDFYFITGKDSAIKNIIRSVQKAGLSLKGLVLEPIASALAVLDEKERLTGVALVDIGGGTTDLAIYHDGVLRHTAVIPLGGNVITEDIQGGCVIIEPQARKLKEKFGSALASENKEDAIISIPGLRGGRPPKEISLKNLSGIIQARMEEILENVLYEIKASGYERKLVGGVVLTGGGALLRHVSQLTEFVLHTDTRIGYPNEHLASSENNEPIASPVFATSVGLVMWGLEKEDPIEEVEDIGETVVETATEETPKKPEKPKVQSASLFTKMSSGFGKITDILGEFMNEVGDDK